MARVYANIFCAIWDDAEFCALSSDAQRTYFMLVTQPDITACGSLPLTMRRWARTVAEHDRASLPDALAELQDRRFVLVDEDTEELLVRSFVKHDGGYKHAKRVLAVLAYAKAVRSPRLRHAVAAELRKLNVSGADEVATECQPIGNEEAIGSRRVVVTEVGIDHNPGTTLQEPESGNQEKNSSSAKLTATSFPPMFEEFWQAYPRKVGKADALRVWQQQRKKVAAAVILAGAVKYRNDPNREDQFTAHPSTWLRRGGWDDDPLPSRTPASTTNAKVNATLALADRFAAEEEDSMKELTDGRNAS